MSDKTKKCSKCGEEILSSAKVCKHCKSDTRGWFARHPIVSSLLILFLFSSALSAISDGLNDTTVSGTSVVTLNVGEEGIINNNEDNGVCDGITVAGTTKDDMNAYIDTIVANDKEGRGELLLSGRIFMVNNCTQIRNIEIGGTLGSLSKIRFLNSGQTQPSATGWIPYEYARRK